MHKKKGEGLIKIVFASPRGRFYAGRVCSLPLFFADRGAAGAAF